ncbi:MAG: HD domain-containing protein [Candidatus Diapherotrites archaeon]|nr:HD domain-containing protein [Candidatus Diapherotrites archaeon]
MVLNIPIEDNKKLNVIIDALKKSPEIEQYWDSANMIAVNRMNINDHGKVHAAIVSNIALRLLRLLTESGLEPAMVKDHKMTKHDSEVVVVLAGLLHDIGHAIHRDKHADFSIVLASGILDKLLSKAYNSKEAVIVKSEILHAIICHHVDYTPLTLEAGCVRIADALDAKEGRARIPFEMGRVSIHSVSAMAIKDIKISKGKSVPVSIEVVMKNSAGIFQVDELIKAKLTNSGLEKYIEIIARIEGEEEKIVKEFRL